jgi:ABC-type ATPase with predicted acetyltransferase domain
MAKSYGTQIDLEFTPETPYVAEWMKNEFSPARGARFKEQGMRTAATSHQGLLAQVNLALIKIALERSDRCVSADDAARWLIEHNYSPASLGNAMGSLFRGAEWVLKGYRPSERASRHRNRIGIWQLAPNSQEG